MFAAIALLLSFVSAPPDSTAAESTLAQVALAVASYTGPLEADGEASTFHVTWADLDADGRDDALVTLHGPSWCTADGCTLLVLQAVPDEDVEELGAYTPAAEISRVGGTVYLLPTATHGWRDLAVAGGTPVRFAFDGETYPTSPTDAVPFGGTLDEAWAVASGRH